MTGLLRSVGLFNAAIWFGAGIFFVFSIEPGANSEPMKALLGEKNFPYFSVALAQLLAGRYFALFLLCGIVSLLHLLAEWLYLGRNPPRFWTMLLMVLLVGGALQAFWLQPKLQQTYLLQFTRPQQRDDLRRIYRFWHGTSQVLDILLLAGLGVYLWRVAHPADATRFVGTPKFRS